MLEEWKVREQEKLNREYTDKYLDLVREAMGVELSEFQKITQTYDNLRRKIKDDLWFNPEAVKQLTEVANSFQKVAEQRKLVEGNLEVFREGITLTKQFADSLKNMFRPLDQTAGQILDIKAANAEFMTDAIDKYKKFAEMYHDNSVLMTQYTDVMETQFSLQKALMDYQLNNVYHPFFKKLDELGTSTADKIGDALNEMIYKPQDAEQLFNQLMEDIQKESTRLID